MTTVPTKVGTFKAGTRKVGFTDTGVVLVYKDAVCGVPLCGEAICGVWWAYPAKPLVDLDGHKPSIVSGPLTLLSPPKAQVNLVNLAPALLILTASVAPPKALFSFLTRAPRYTADSTLLIPEGVLRLAGQLPHFVGQEWLHEADCEEFALVAAGSREITLKSIDCR